MCLRRRKIVKLTVSVSHRLTSMAIGMRTDPAHSTGTGDDWVCITYDQDIAFGDFFVTLGLQQLVLLASITDLLHGGNY